MWWKQSRDEFARNKGANNRRAFKRMVEAGSQPGLIAYRDGVPVGWCAVEPREHYPLLRALRRWRRSMTSPYGRSRVSSSRPDIGVAASASRC